MQVIITARHCEISDDVRAHVEKRLELLTRFEPRAARTEAAITGTRNGFEAEAVVSVDGSERIHGRAEGDDMRTAIDRLIDKLGVQLRRRHGRRREHRAPPTEELFEAPPAVEAEGAEEA